MFVVILVLFYSCLLLNITDVRFSIVTACEAEAVTQNRKHCPSQFEPVLEQVRGSDVECVACPAETGSVR